MDSVLREILEAEIANHLDTIKDWLNTAAGQSYSVNESLLRAVHTLNGAFAMTKMPEITQVMQSAETYIKRLLTKHQKASVEGVGVLSAMATAIADTLTALRSDSPRIPSFVSLVSCLSELVTTMPDGGQSQQQYFESVAEQNLESVPEQTQDVSLSNDVLTDVYDLSVNLDVLEPLSAVVEPEKHIVDRPQHEVAHQYNNVAASTMSDVVAADSNLDVAAHQYDLVSGNESPADELGLLAFDEPAFELVDLFVEESSDLLDHCDNLLAKLHEAPQDRELLVGLQRDLHTLKGGARMAGINAIGDLGHSIESMLESVMADYIMLNRDDMRLLEYSFDYLHQMLTQTRQHRVVTMPSDLVATLKARTQGATHDGMSNFGEVAELSLIADVSSNTLLDKESQVLPDTPAILPPLSLPIPLEGQDEDSSLERLVQEQVRVRADLLDRLVNHAGEVAIYRSQLEQRLSAFRNAMSELGRTNTRLRDQLRRLDLETEAQIVARYQHEKSLVSRDFDPLELDRFSTLQQLSRALNESAADLTGLQGVLDELARQYDGLLQQQFRVSSELQDGLMRARMVPFNSILPRLRRVVRQAEADTNKHVHLVLEGTHGELDRNVIDRMVAPLEHMLRNAVAHGLEMPEKRRAAGKADEGKITIQLQREGSEILLKVSDDGAGLDRDAIQRRAKQRGLIPIDVNLSDAELDGIIFTSGFTTYDEVNQLAGRGVGMDVVRSEVSQLGGSVSINSVRGHGVTFTLRLPQTLAVTQAVFIRIGQSTFAVPVASVIGIGRIAHERYKSDHESYHYDGEQYVLYDLGFLIGQPGIHADRQQVPLLLVRTGDLRVAVAVDEVLGNREIVVKPVGLQIASVPGIYGATITGDGCVIVILDLAPLVRRYLNQPIHLEVEEAPVTQSQMPLVMVVDDSLTMRKVTSRVLERHNFSVSVARDGIEALELLEERIPDLMLLDIEMPRMDGYELVAAMRADDRFKSIPILMITSRSGDKHRQRAFEIGVQRYLGKPYQEFDLMKNVYDLLGVVRVRE